MIEQRRNEIISGVKKWMLYKADFGYTKLTLDECPVHLTEPDRKMVLEWLSGEGFTVTGKWPFSRTIINMERSETNG